MVDFPVVPIVSTIDYGMGAEWKSPLRDWCCIAQSYLGATPVNIAFTKTHVAPRKHQRRHVNA
jgi:hypothetical protein